jgi:hypothetical protein
MGNGRIPTPCKEFLNASWWYFVGPPPKHLSSFRRFLIANGIRL